jgi:hypothetical protein
MFGDAAVEAGTAPVDDAPINPAGQAMRDLLAEVTAREKGQG